MRRLTYRIPPRRRGERDLPERQVSRDVADARAGIVRAKLESRGFTIVSDEEVETVESLRRRIAENDAAHNALVDELVDRGAIEQERAESLRRK